MLSLKTYLIFTEGGDAMTKKVCGLVLAAGLSSRMGTVKPILKTGGETVIDLTTKCLSMQASPTSTLCWAATEKRF